MSQSLAEKYFIMLHHPMFPQADQMLRRGAHIGEEDHDKHDFIRDAEESLHSFYRLYDANLAQTPEGTYYLVVNDSPHFKSLTLSRLDMIIGKTLAGMMLEPDILSTMGRVALEKLLHTLELHPGRETLLAVATIRNTDEESANKKLREAIGRSLNTLSDMNFIVWNVRNEEIIPFKAVMRFADDVRTTGSLEENLAQQLMNGAAVLQTDPSLKTDEAPPGDADHEED